MAISKNRLKGSRIFFSFYANLFFIHRFLCVKFSKIKFNGSLRIFVYDIIGSIQISFNVLDVGQLENILYNAKPKFNS